MSGKPVGVPAKYFDQIDVPNAFGAIGYERRPSAYTDKDDWPADMLLD
jgi:hypothetical protein